jgi:hypothetical protein
VTVEDYSPTVEDFVWPVIAPAIDTLEALGIPMSKTRGERNKNPGNLRYDGTAWLGLIGADDGGYCIFDTDAHGLRALARDIQSKAARGVDTVREVVTVYAPAFENNTEAYIAAVSSYCGVSADDVPDRFKLLKAIVRHENGRISYTDAQFAQAIADAAA